MVTVTLYSEVTDFAQFTIDQLEVPKKALWVRELIFKLIKSEADFLELLHQIDKLASNKIFEALKRMERARQFAVGYVNVDGATYVYGTRKAVDDHIKQYRTVERNIYIQPVNCKYFDSEVEMKAHLECVVNTYSGVSGGEDLTGKVNLVAV